MPTNITINTLSGLTPYNVYVCDSGNTSCIYVNTITDLDIPYSFELPGILNSLTTFNVKVVDSNNCDIIELITL